MLAFALYCVMFLLVALVLYVGLGLLVFGLNERYAIVPEGLVGRITLILALLASFALLAGLFGHPRFPRSPGVRHDLGDTTERTRLLEVEAQRIRTTLAGIEQLSLAQIENAFTDALACLEALLAETSARQKVLRGLDLELQQALAESAQAKRESQEIRRFTQPQLEVIDRLLTRSSWLFFLLGTVVTGFLSFTAPLVLERLRKTRPDGGPDRPGEPRWRGA